MEHHFLGFRIRQHWQKQHKGDSREAGDGRDDKGSGSETVLVGVADGDVSIERHGGDKEGRSYPADRSEDVVQFAHGGTEDPEADDRVKDGRWKGEGHDEVADAQGSDVEDGVVTMTLHSGRRGVQRVVGFWRFWGSGGSRSSRGSRDSRGS